jgi:hypothetical protein
VGPLSISKSVTLTLSQTIIDYFRLQFAIPAGTILRLYTTDLAPAFGQRVEIGESVFEEVLGVVQHVGAERV